MWKFVIVQKYNAAGEKEVKYYTLHGFVDSIKDATLFDTYPDGVFNAYPDGPGIGIGIYQIEKIYIVFE